MRISVKIIFSLFILLISIPLLSAEKMRVAILDLQPKGVSKVLAGSVSELIRADMIDVGIFTVVERGQMMEILKEQGFQQTGCTDSSCAVQLGKIVSARKILVGEVSKMGTTFLITVRIVDVEKGVAEFAAREKANTENELDGAAQRISLKLSERISGKRGAELLAHGKRKTTTGYYLRGIVPGWGQVYAGHPVKGYVLMGGFAAAGGFFGYTLYNYFDKRQAYRDVPEGSLQSAFDDKYKAYESAGTMAYIGFGIFAAVYLYNWVDVLFFSRPVIETASCPGVPAIDGWYVSIDTLVPVNESRDRGVTLALRRMF